MAPVAQIADYAQFFVLERHLSQQGTEILLTKDHIIPKAKNGADSLDNMQTMCTICNSQKADSTNEL